MRCDQFSRRTSSAPVRTPAQEALQTHVRRTSPNREPVPGQDRLPSVSALRSSLSINADATGPLSTRATYARTPRGRLKLADASAFACAERLDAAGTASAAMREKQSEGGATRDGSSASTASDPYTHPASVASQRIKMCVRRRRLLSVPAAYSHGPGRELLVKILEPLCPSGRWRWWLGAIAPVPGWTISRGQSALTTHKTSRCRESILRPSFPAHHVVQGKDVVVRPSPPWQWKCSHERTWTQRRSQVRGTRLARRPPGAGSVGDPGSCVRSEPCTCRRRQLSNKVRSSAAFAAVSVS